MTLLFLSIKRQKVAIVQIANMQKGQQQKKVVVHPGAKLVAREGGYPMFKKN